MTSSIKIIINITAYKSQEIWCLLNKKPVRIETFDGIKQSDNMEDENLKT